MKKKYRDITVDGEKYAWSVKEMDSLAYDTTFKIWKDNRVIYQRNWGGDVEGRAYIMTPGKVARFIKLYLKNEKRT